jgi:hypothetical protein
VISTLIFLKVMVAALTAIYLAFLGAHSRGETRFAEDAGLAFTSATISLVACAAFLTRTLYPGLFLPLWEQKPYLLIIHLIAAYPAVVLVTLSGGFYLIGRSRISMVFLVWLSPLWLIMLLTGMSL